MLPNVLQTSASDHVPVLAEEVRERLAVRPGETVVDATFGAGGHSSLLAADLRGQGQADRDRPRSDRARLLRPLQAPRGRPGAPPPRRVLARARPARRQRRPGGRDPARPRRLLDADRPARARLLVRGRRAARHADGPFGRAHRARARQRGRGARARADLPPLRRGALRAADRPRDRRAGAPSARSSARASSSRRSSTRSRRRRASATGIPPSASSRRSGSPSTTSSARSRRRCRRPCGCCARAAGSR